MAKTEMTRTIEQAINETEEKKIISALKNHLEVEACEDCKSFGLCDEFVPTKKVLDLINNQKTEINRLQDELELYKKANLLIARQRDDRDKEIERLTELADENFEQWNMLAEKTKQHYEELYQEAKEAVKHEAYREFANKAVDRLTANYSSEYTHWIDDTIDQVLGELGGERE
jgi:hypothetical protein